MRVFSATMAIETNTFSPTPAGLDSFRTGIFFPASVTVIGDLLDPLVLSAPIGVAQTRIRTLF